MNRFVHGARRFASSAARIALFALFLGATTAFAAPEFHEIPDDRFAGLGYPASSRFFEMDFAEMRATLAEAPAESFPLRAIGSTITLPLPDGGSERFAVWETPLLHPELGAQFPEIKTYAGRGLDDRTATIRLDATPHGFHALILSLRAPMFIDPVQMGDTRTYASHFKRTGVGDAADEPFGCEMVSTPAIERELEELLRSNPEQTLAASNGTHLRTYRTAIATTGEYANFHGGTVLLAMAALTTSLNRVTGIYEREVSVRMQLIPNNNLIVYTNSATDPYTNNNGSVMLGQNQANLDSVIGSANYDIGHVFSTGGGGIAGLGVVCRANNKARGVTGSFAPIGDAFDVDYVAHEMGHQFGATHSFNGNAGSCAGNRTGSTAYEPGSGSTIMSYAGICGAQNIAAHSHPEFHGGSFDQIVVYTQSGLGNSCPVVTATGNTPPVAVAGNAGLTIPKETPFILYGVGTDADDDVVSYSWEEFDLGPSGPPDMPAGNAPIFRSWPPRDREWRMFPRRVDVIDNTPTIGEILPTYTRTLNFRLSVRDNLGGLGNSSTTLSVDGSSGPFLVTGIDATPWIGGESRTVTWDVAGTSGAPVSCATVNIVLSTNGGTDFLQTLLAGTPNDGSESIVVPNLPTTTARVQVEAVGNVFFDMNNADFEIVAGTTGIGDVAVANDVPALEVRPNPFTNRTRITFALERAGTVALEVFDAAGRRVTTLAKGARDAGTHSVEWNGDDASGRAAAPGVYFVRLESEDAVRTVGSLRLR